MDDLHETMNEVKAQLRIIGTSHIAHHSARQIQHIYKEFEPDIIAVELDARRLDALLHPPKKDEGIPLSMIKEVGITGYLFLTIGKMVQKKLGSVVKVQPGVDMLAAVKLAHENNKQLHLVDQDIVTTMKHLSKKFTFKEKMRVLWDVISSPFSKRMKKLNFDLSKVPDEQTLEVLVKMLKDRYPTLYNVLIVERNIVMARNLDAIVRRNPGKKLLLVIGAGHEDDLRIRLKHMENITEVI